jgi:hypothetical protein
MEGVENALANGIAAAPATTARLENFVGMLVIGFLRGIARIGIRKCNLS